jgi:hypothetical protein
MADGRWMMDHFLSIGETTLLSPIEEATWVTMMSVDHVRVFNQNG